MSWDRRMEVMCMRGDIFFVDFGEHGNSHKQSGVRPAVIVSNNRNNRNSPVVTVVPLSARVWKKKYLPTHVQIPLSKSEGLDNVLGGAGGEGVPGKRYESAATPTPPPGPPAQRGT